MTSRIKVQRICQFCGKEFTAHTTVTKCCSLSCSRLAYKERKRTERIDASNNETQLILKQPFELLKVKPFLSISEACILLGVSRRTVQRMIKRGDLHVAKAGARTILKRADIDMLFDRRIIRPSQKETQPITEFYTVEEIEKKYFIKYGRLNSIIAENKIPKTIHNGKLHVSKFHLDRYFKSKRNDVGAITEWYTIEEIQEKYLLSRDQIYYKVHDNKVPKQRVGKFVKISQKHFDELFVIGV